MSDRMTSCGPRQTLALSAPSFDISIADYGRKTRPEMVAQFRRYHQRRLEQSQAALALSDDELIVETYVGVWAQRNSQEVTS